MAENYVEIRIKASDTAKPDLTDLKVKLDELGAKVETARVDVNDEDGKAKLLAMNAKLAALNQRVANPRIKVAGAARAEAEIAAVELEMDKLDRKAQQNSSKGGLLGKLLFGSGGGSGSSGDGKGGLLGSFKSLPSVSGGGGILGSITQLASNPYGLAAVASGAQAALVEVTGLASGFAAAGAGAGAFALLAKPAVTSVTTAYTNLNTAMTKYQAAQAKEAMAPSKANATAVKNALTNVNLAGEAIQKLPQSEQNAVDGLERLSTSFHKLSAAFQPEAFKVFADGLKIANSLLPTLTPFANSFANALDGLLKKAAGFAQSKGFKDWLAQFQKLTGPSLTAIGTGVGKVAIEFGKLLTIMSKKDVVNSINIAFTVLAKTITAIGLVVRFAMKQWDLLTTAVDRGRTAIKASLSWFGGLGGMFSRWWGAAVSAASGQIGRLLNLAASIRGRILGALGNLGGLLFGAGQRVIQGLIRGIGSMIGAVGSAIGNIAGEITSHLPFSPAKKGPLSGAGSPDKAGRRIGQMLAQGMSGSTSAVSAAAAHMAGGAVTGGTGRGGAGAGGTLKVQLEFVGGDDMLLRGLRNAIRVRGGNVQAVLGH